MAKDESGAVEYVWNKAIRIFNDCLTNDPRKVLQLPSPCNLEIHCSLECLIRATEEAHSDCYNKHIPGGAKLQRALQSIHKYALVVDVLVQHQPHFTALVWGIIRFLIQVSVAEIDLGAEIGTTLQDLLKQVGRYELEARLFFDEPLVLDSIAALFSQIINYLVRAKVHFTQSKLIRSARATFSNKLGQILATIGRCSSNLDREVRTAAETRRSRCGKAAEAECRKQEIFREGSHNLKPHWPSVGSSDPAAECRTFFRRIDALDLKPEVTELRDMLKYFSSHLQSYKNERESQDKISTILQWLKDGAAKPDLVPQREPGTCEWICRRSQYQLWLENPGRQCLWIHGILGSGKSVLSSFLMEKAFTWSKIVLHYSFNSALDSTSAKGTTFLLSLLLQLCLNEVVISDSSVHPALEKIIWLVSHSRHSLDCSSTVLLTILEEVLECLPTYVLIVDALDDCVGQDDLFEASRYVHQLGMRPKSHVVVLSRASTRLQAVFRDAAKISMECEDVMEDIKLYLNRRVDRSSNLNKLRAEIIAKACSDESGMFLWAKFMVDGLEQSLGTVSMIRRRLLCTPVKIYDLYEQQLELNSLKFSPEALSKRDEIFLLLIGLKRPLPVGDISAALALDTKTDLIDEEDEFIEPPIEIEKLCRPLVKVEGDIVQFVHVSVNQFMLERKMSEENSNLFLARKTLSKLSQPQYKDWGYAAGLLREHLLSGNTIINSLERPERETVFYNYACLHWHEHITALSDPPEDILKKLATFITGNEFVTWSEVLFDLKYREDLGPLIQVRTVLMTWYSILAPPIKALVPIDKYFVVPHENLRSELDQKSKDKLLPYLPLIRLGDYFNVGGQSTADWQKGYDYKRTVAGGLQNLLGARDPFTLRAETLMLQEFFWQKKFLEAEQGLYKVAKIQLEVLGKDKVDYWATSQLLGYAQFSLTNFDDARTTLTQTEEGLREIVGESHIYYLMNGLYKGYVLERQAETEAAYELYHGIWKKWTSTMGQSNPFSLMLQTAIGSVCRKLKNFEAAEESLLEAWAARQRIFSIEINVCVDSALQLALTYREAGSPHDAAEILGIISSSQIFQTDFERDCQLKHISALLLLDTGQYPEARRMLEKLLASDRDKNNRELLWVRLDLADILRKHGEEDEALMLFSDLVEPIPRQSSPQEFSQAADGPPTPSSLDDEPEPVKRLKIAEQALELVREAKPDTAEKLLHHEGLRWARQEDFWILQGGPVTDTAQVNAVETCSK